MPAGLESWSREARPRRHGVLDPPLDLADARQVLVELALVGLGDAVANAVGVVQHVVDHALAVEVAIGDGRLREAVCPLGEQAVEDDLGVHLVWGGRGRRPPGDVRLVGPAVAERVAGAGRLAAELEAGESGLVADVRGIELVDRDADADGVLGLVRLGAGEEAGGTLAVAAAFGVAVGQGGVVRQPMKAVEIVAGERERLERLGQVDQRALARREPGRQVDAVGDVPEAHPDGRARRLRDRRRRRPAGSPATAARGRLPCRGASFAGS